MEEEGYTTVSPNRGRDDIGGYSGIAAMRRGREEEQDQRRAEVEEEEAEEEGYSSNSGPSLRRGQMRYHRLHQFSRLPPVPERYLVTVHKNIAFGSIGICLWGFFLECLPFASAGQAWRTESCPLCRTLSPPPHPSSPPPPHLLPLPPPPADRHSPPRIDQRAGNPPQRSGVWRRRRRGGEGLARAEQVQPWAGGGAGYLSPGTKEGGGSEGERSDIKREIMSDGNAVQCHVKDITSQIGQ